LTTSYESIDTKEMFSGLEKKLHKNLFFQSIAIVAGIGIWGCGST
jgi:hypothetical protein